MKIVITGGLGHIGSRLLRDLPRHVNDLEITIIDNLMTQRYASLFDLPSKARCRFVEGDATSINLAPYFEGVDAVIHLAAITDATSSFDKQEEVERVNFSATKNVAEACISTGAALIYPSSTSVYGTQKEVVDEDCGPEDLKPQSPYAETKLREEAFLTDLSATQNLQCFIGRLGTIFGTSPGMRFHTAVNKFCWQAVMGIPLTVWQTAYEQKRPYLGLNDVVRAIAFILDRGLFDGRIYNVVSANVTVREIVEQIRERVPSTEVTFVQSKIMNQLSYEASSERFRNAGFQPEENLGTGIAQTIALLNASNLSPTSDVTA
jgi:UDP-glucose 4-epimerase